MNQIIDQWVRTDDKTNLRRTKKGRISYLYTKFEDGSIKGEPIPTSQALKWMAENNI